VERRSGTWKQDVSYRGAAGIPVPLAWGQQTTWTDIQHFMPIMKPFFIIKRRIDLPCGAALGDVLVQIGELISRHEALRSNYWTHSDGTGMQKVRDGGHIEVTIIDAAPSDFESELNRQEEIMVGSTFDHAVELPVRVVVGLLNGVPATALLGVSHVAVDAQGARLLAEELSTLIAAHTAGKALPPPRVARQPADESDFERSPAGRELNAAAMAYVRRQLCRIPAPIFSGVNPVHGARFRRGELRSTAIPLALRLLAQRLHTSTSILLLAAFAGQLRTLSTAAAIPITLVYGNRADPQLRYSISSLSQTVLSVIDVEVDSFAQLVKNATSAAMQAYRHGRFDPLEFAAVVDEVVAKRGTVPELMCRFNDMRFPDGGQASLPPDEVLRQEPRGTFQWIYETDDDKITAFLDVYGEQGLVTLRLLADTGKISQPETEGILRGIERVLVETALASAG
jgi:hypothetical protein